MLAEYKSFTVEQTIFLESIYSNIVKNYFISMQLVYLNLCLKSKLLRLMTFYSFLNTLESIPTKQDFRNKHIMLGKGYPFTMVIGIGVLDVVYEPRR